MVGPPKSDAGVRDVAVPPHLIPVEKTHLKNQTGPRKDALLFPAAGDPLAELMRRLRHSTP